MVIVDLDYCKCLIIYFYIFLVMLMQSKWMEQLWCFGWIPPPQKKIPHFLTANPEGSPKDWDDLGHWNKAGRLSSWWCGCLLGNHCGFTPEIRWHPSGCVGRMWSNEPPPTTTYMFDGRKVGFKFLMLFGGSFLASVAVGVSKSLRNTLAKGSLYGHPENQIPKLSIPKAKS